MEYIENGLENAENAQEEEADEVSRPEPSLAESAFAQSLFDFLHGGIYSKTKLAECGLVAIKGRDCVVVMHELGHGSRFATTSKFGGLAE